MLDVVGDIGGTNSRFALAETVSDGSVKLHHIQNLPNKDYDSFEDVLAAYLNSVDRRPSRALFAVAGPVDGEGRVRLTNRNWPKLDAKSLKHTHQLSQVHLVNDLAALARAVPELPETAFTQVKAGNAVTSGTVIVTGPGTGFGVATLYKDTNGIHRVLSGEGGHAAYPPQTEIERKLAESMRAEFGYLSNEMIVSGAWMEPVFAHLKRVLDIDLPDLSPADILDRAGDGDALCREFCLLRARAILGAAGDLVLVNAGLGGVVLSGGGAERMVPWLRSDDAIARFVERGSHTSYIANVPVSVITDSMAALIGAKKLLDDSGIQA